MKNHRRKVHQAEEEIYNLRKLKKDETAERSKSNNSQQKLLAPKKSKMSPKKPRMSPSKNGIASPKKLMCSPTKQNQQNLSETSKFQNKPNDFRISLLASSINSLFLVHCPACDQLNPNCPNCVALYHQKYWEWAMLLHQQRILQARNPQHQMIPAVPEPNQTRGITHIYEP